MEQDNKIKEFIRKAREVHGDTYDYSKVEYVNNKTKVIIICKEHGNFEQTPDSHLRGCGCPKCGIEKRATNRRSSTDEFINKAHEIHGYKYDYSKVEYKKAIEKVIIICKEHGNFEQVPNSHLNGSGCPTCADETRNVKKTTTTDEFKTKAQEIHGYKYDYSKVEYVNCKSKVIMLCNEHGEFEQTPDDHLQGRGCNKCGIESSTAKKRYSIDEFITKAQEIHGDEYDYSKVEYINNHTHIMIICKEHGVFEQMPATHISKRDKSGCPKCVGRLLTKEEFINKAQEIHNHKYDYSNINFTNMTTKIKIICKKHGEFEPLAGVHMRGSGCDKCSRNQSIISRKDFIECSINIHGNEYDYSKVEYINNTAKVIIICKEHGIFEQAPNSHLHGCGCPKCGIEKRAVSRRSSTDEFINKAQEIHGYKYEYSKVEYVNSQTKVIITCKEHGDFEQTPSGHLVGECLKCSINFRGTLRRKTTEQFVVEAKQKHRDKYDYSKVDYNNTHENVVIVCNSHGEFQQTPNSHLRGTGCPMCVNKTEGKLYETMKQIYPTLIRQFRQDWCKRLCHLPFDLCIPEYKIIIELDGAQHFRQIRNWSSPEEQFKNDKYKEDCANENGYSVIRLLQEDVFYDTYDWVKELCDTIEEVKSSEGITNVYLCQNEEYDKF